MSERKPRKRDQIRAIFLGPPESPNEKKASRHSRATSESRNRISRAVSPATSVLGGAVGLNVTTTSSTSAPSPSTQQFTPAIESSVDTKPGGTTQDVTPKSTPTNPPGPISPTATATAKNIAHTRKDAAQTQTGMVEPISTATSGTAAESLWSKAFKSSELSLHEREILEDIVIEPGSCQNVAAALGTMTEGIVNGKNREDWKFEFNGEVIVMRDVGMKILRWVDRFREIGDIIVQYDPGHAALPWAGFRLLLKVELRCQLLHLKQQPSNDNAHSSAWINSKQWTRSW